MKQTRKNKTNQSVTWPTSVYFTIKDLVRLNPKFIEITLRVRLANAIDPEGKVVEIGSIPGGHGRPPKIFAMTPVTQKTLNTAKEAGINLVDNAEQKLVNVVSVTKPTASTTSVTPVSVSSPAIVR